MTLFKYTMITLLIIVTIFITREITIYTYKCPGKPVFKSRIPFNDNFKTMFIDPSPWRGINQTLFGLRSEDSVTPMDDNY